MNSFAMRRHVGLLGAGLPLTGRAWAHEAWARQDAVFRTLVWGFPPTWAGIMRGWDPSRTAYCRTCRQLPWGGSGKPAGCPYGALPQAGVLAADRSGRRLAASRAMAPALRCPAVCAGPSGRSGPQRRKDSSLRFISFLFVRHLPVEVKTTAGG